MDFHAYLKLLKGVDSPRQDQYGKWLGYEIDAFDQSEKTIKTSLEIRDEHLSPSGAVHGGVVSGFLDFSCGAAVFAHLDLDELCSTVDLSVKYFRPVLSGDRIIAEPKVVHKGKTLSSVTTFVKMAGSEDRPVAMATATFNIYKFKKFRSK